MVKGSTEKRRAGIKVKGKLAGTALIVFFSLVLLVSGCGGDEEESVESASPVVETEPAPTLPPEETPPVTEPEVEEPPPVEEPGPEPPADEAVAENKSFIWEIKSDVSSVYLLGSIHVATFAFYPLDSTIEEAFKVADNLVVEVNFKEVDEMESAQLMIDYGTYPLGETLRDNIPEDLYTELDDLLDTFGVDIAMLEMFKPWAISTILEQIQMEELGYSPAYGIDMYFTEKAVSAGKDIIGLETPELQVELLSSFSDELMIFMLEESVEEPLTQEDVDELFEIWENGDADEMEALVYEPLIEEPKLAPFFDVMLDERNFNMAGKIEEYLADDEVYFVVVGAAHLIGEKGLVSILDKRGYSAEQLYDSD